MISFVAMNMMLYGNMLPKKAPAPRKKRQLELDLEQPVTKAAPDPALDTDDVRSETVS